MQTTTLYLRVSPRRMLTVREAADYCGVPAKQLPVTPVEMPGGKRLYDVRDLDEYLDGLKLGQPSSDDEIVGRLGT